MLLYDLFQSKGPWWCTVMGDVCGKGTEAAAKVTAPARYTLRMRASRARSRQKARIAELIEATRRGTHTAPDGSVLQTVAAHRDTSGHPSIPIQQQSRF
ncbi:hypothetical protein [Streptomyces sp. 1222.5]|uniref:hypothetical protein n=1 Tax=unclassified Streptomyces TaxID=2593676 RepID=UPI0026B2BB11